MASEVSDEDDELVADQLGTGDEFVAMFADIFIYIYICPRGSQAQHVACSCTGRPEAALQRGRSTR